MMLDKAEVIEIAKTKQDSTETQPRKTFDPKHANAGRIMREAPDEIPWVVESLFPVDVGMLNATGGTGKSTLMLWLAVRYVLGMDLLGCDVLVPGKVLIISGEDPEGRIGYRMNRVIEAMGLTDEQKQVVANNIFIEDCSDIDVAFVESTFENNLQGTPVVSEIIEAYKDQRIQWIILDPLINFGAGEHLVNHGYHHLLIACRRLVRAFNCFVQLVHHVSKEVAVNKIIGQHAGRGGTTIGDGSRFESQLVQYRGKFKDMPPSVPSDIFARGGTALAFHVHKLSDAGLPAKPYVITRLGFEFTYYPHNDQPNTAMLEAGIEYSEQIKRAIIGYVDRHGKEYLTKNSLRMRGEAVALEAGLESKLSKGVVDDYIKALVGESRLVVRDLPKDHPLRQGERKNYLDVPTNNKLD